MGSEMCIRDSSSVPLDDQLPYLLGVESAGASEATDEPAGGDTQSSDGEAEAVDLAARALSATGFANDAPEAGASAEAGEALLNDTSQVAGASGMEAGGAVVVVHVSGAVANPGVVELVEGARVHHAVDGAGGATSLADLERVNLAALLVDGERIHVPEVGELDVPQVVAPNRLPEPFFDRDDGADEAGADELVSVDVNRASIGELERLPGIGPSIARAILDLRTARGAYASVDELLLVDGIGPAKLEALRPHAHVTLDR